MDYSQPVWGSEDSTFTSIATADPCMLDGTYGTVSVNDVEQIFIRHTVSGCDIPNDAYVL